MQLKMKGGRDEEMKKWRILLFVLVMSVLLAACGGSTEDDVPIVTEAAEATAKPDFTAKPERETTPIPTEAPVEFKEITVIDNEECAIRITDIDPDDSWGYTIKACFENRSADKNYMFSVQTAAVNGIEADPFFATTIAAGKKGNSKIQFSNKELYEPDIGDFTDIEITFRVYDSDDWMADAVALETVHIYPYGEENAKHYVRAAQPQDIVLIDNDSVSVIVTGFTEDSIWGYTANLYLVNKTDKELMFAVDDVSVNGFMADPFWARSLTGGKVCFTSMSWSNSTLEENGIETVEEIEMNLRAYDSNNWNAKDIFNEIVTIKP